MKLKEILDKTQAFFRDKGIESARLDAELLLAHGLKVERIRLYIDFDRPLGEDEISVCRELVRRRAQGEPVAYIVGAKDFFGQTFAVGPGVLIPRPETEHLVEEALKAIQPEDAVLVADLGCGSGCVGLSVLKERPNARLIAMDLSAVALSFTRANAERLGVADRVTIIEGDASSSEARDRALAAAGADRVNVVLANPPYIASDDPAVEANVRKFEPGAALFAEDGGLAALKSWAVAWRPALAPGGLLAMEMGTSQGAAMTAHFADAGLRDVAVRKDLSGHDRIIRGVKNG